MGIKTLELLIIFTMSINLFSGMLIASGAAQDMGLGGQVNVGQDDKVDSVIRESQNVSTGAPTGSTLFGSYNVLSNTLGRLRVIVYAFPAMLGNMGAESWVTAPLEGLITVVYALGIIKFFRGI
jgi:hypothetical protein